MLDITYLLRGQARQAARRVAIPAAFAVVTLVFVSLAIIGLFAAFFFMLEPSQGPLKAALILSGGLSINLQLINIVSLSGCLFIGYLGVKSLQEALSTPVDDNMQAIRSERRTGFVNGFLVVQQKTEPFIITLGTMWIYRGIAFVTTQAESLVGPDSLTSVMKATFGLGGGIYPVPLLILVGVAVLGTIFLTKTVAGRYVFAVGGNLTASVYSGVNVGGVLVLVYAICGLMAGLSAFMGCGYYSGANCNDAQGYELYVIASAVVGGVSLVGGKGSALGATLGALLIILIRQSISFLHLDQNYQWIIIGAAIVAAVVLDRTSSALGLKRLASSKTTGGT